MNLSLSDEQVMLREAAAGALSRLDTVSNARDALDGAPLLDLWQTAREAGWCGLLVSPEHGGAGLGTYDAMLVFEECGRRLAGNGLLGHLPATLVVSQAAVAGDSNAAALLPDLVDGLRRAAFVHARPPSADEEWTTEGIGTRERQVPAPVLRHGAVTGTAGFQPDAADAALLVVPAIDEDGVLRVVAVERSADGVSVERITRFDATRPLGHVHLHNARGVQLQGSLSHEVTCAWYLSQALLAADALGLSEAMLEMSVAYAKERVAFGRPIGSYQAIKHQIVEILRHVETTRNLCLYVALATEEGNEELALATSAARFAAETSAEYATRTSIAVHGGIGATWEHDAHLFWRRAQLARLLLGGIDDAGNRVADEIIARARLRTTPAPR